MKTIKSYDLFSDMHFMHSSQHTLDQYGEYFIKEWLLKGKTSDVAVVAGDFCQTIEVCADVVNIMKGEWVEVVFTDGNHEHYSGGGVDENCARLFEQFEDDANVSFLNSNHYIIGDTAFLGANGWYDFNATDASFKAQRYEWQTTMNDARLIYFEGIPPDIRAGKVASEFEAQLKSLNKNETVKKVVITTHTPPRKEALVEKGHPFYPLNGSFFNSKLDSLSRNTELMQKVVSWNFGHTHFAFDKVLDGVRYVCNPRGYPGETHHTNYICNQIKI